MELDTGQLAYETRFAGFTLGPRGVAPSWADLPEVARAIWRRVEHAVMEACVNGVWRLAISAEETEPLRVLQLPAIDPQASATLAPDPAPPEIVAAIDMQGRAVGLSFGFGRGLQPDVVRHVEEFIRDIPLDLVIIGDHKDVLLGPPGGEPVCVMVEVLALTLADELEPEPEAAPIGRTDTVASARAKGFSGNICQSCGSLSMVRSGTCETCQQCGTTGGCG